MSKKIKSFWSMIAVVVCYGLAMTVLVHGGPEGTEEVPRWAFSLVSLTFTAIGLVDLHMCLNAQANHSQTTEE